MNETRDHAAGVGQRLKTLDRIRSVYSVVGLWEISSVRRSRWQDTV